LAYLPKRTALTWLVLFSNLLNMKKVAVFITCLFLFSAVNSQISVKVRKNTNGGDLDIKTSGNKSKSASGNQQSGAGNTNSGNKDVSEPPPQAPNPKPVVDTPSRPAATTTFDESYSGPAKVQLKSFWRQLDKLRAGDMGAVNNAERMLGQVKEKDPSYNVSALEKEVAGYREAVDKKAKAVNESAGNAKAERDYYDNVWRKMIGVYSRGNTIEPGVTGKVYYDRVQAVNLADYQSKKGSAGDGSKKLIESIEEMLTDYGEYLKRTDRLRWNVTEVMVKARGEANPQKKMQLLEQAKYECEAVLVLAPENASFKQKLEEVKKLLGNADAEAAKNYTSDFHKEQVGKIVWSAKPLVIGKEKEMSGLIRNEFKAGEAVFGTVYLGNPVKQLMEGNEELHVIIKVDGGTAVWGGDLSYFIIPLSVQDKSYIQFALLPDEDWFAKNYAPYLAKENWTYSYFMDDLVQAGDISHTITCEVDFPSSIQRNIKSSLTLDLGSGITQLKTLSTKLHNQMMATRTLPKAGMSNPALEAQMLTAANNLGWNDKFLKTIITSSSWAVAKNELTGVILYRYVGAVCTIKGTDGKCYYQEFTFRQDYTGGGNYSSAVKYNSYGSKREIGCDKIK
jgi:hypothetical protein